MTDPGVVGPGFFGLAVASDERVREDAKGYLAVNTPADREKPLACRDQATAEKDVPFGGRLGTSEYLDMHTAVGAAMSMVDNKLAPYFKKGEALVSGGVEA